MPHLYPTVPLLSPLRSPAPGPFCCAHLRLVRSGRQATRAHLTIPARWGLTSTIGNCQAGSAPSCERELCEASSPSHPPPPWEGWARDCGQPYSQPFTRPQPTSNSGQSWACLTKHILDKPTEAAPSHQKGLSGEEQNRTVPLGGAGQRGVSDQTPGNFSMILRKSLPSTAPQTGVSPCLPGSPGPAILGDKYYVRSLPHTSSTQTIVVLIVS